MFKIQTNNSIFNLWLMDTCIGNENSKGKSGYISAQKLVASGEEGYKRNASSFWNVDFSQECEAIMTEYEPLFM